jgi:hypothetical protein
MDRLRGGFGAWLVVGTAADRIATAASQKPERLTIKKGGRMAEEKILTKHPLGKSGKNISKQKYETLKKAILSALRNKELSHTELFNRLNKSLKSKFSGNISWYGETVKLDLEGRKIIERTSSKPQKYRLKSTGPL